MHAQCVPSVCIWSACVQVFDKLVDMICEKMAASMEAAMDGSARGAHGGGGTRLSANTPNAAQPPPSCPCWSALDVRACSIAFLQISDWRPADSSTRFSRVIGFVDHWPDARCPRVLLLISSMSIFRCNPQLCSRRCRLLYTVLLVLHTVPVWRVPYSHLMWMCQLAT